MKHHAYRTFLRFLVLVTGDIASAAAAYWLLRAIGWGLSNQVGRVTGLQAFDPSLLPRFEVFAAALVFGLATTGNYSHQGWAAAGVSRVRGTLLAGVLLSWTAIQAHGVIPAVMPFIVTVIGTSMCLAIARLASGRVLGALFAGTNWATRAVVVGDPNLAAVPGEEETPPPDRSYRVIGYVTKERQASNGALGPISDLGELINKHGIEAVIVPAHLSDSDLENVLDVCLTSGCEILYPARSVRVAGIQPALIWRGEEPFFELGTPVLKAQQLLVKRCIDIAGALVGLFVLTPALLAIALAIKVDTAGPVFFSQFRAGLGGRRFRMLKFRTMRAGADTEKLDLAHLNHTGDSRLFKIPDDPRVTRVGRLLRRWSLDELPQLWNVLRGDMSLVGPRPFFESDLEDYEAHHFRRLGAKPGITGLWQVSGRSRVVDFEEVVRLDRHYIEQWSIWLDISVLLRTIPAVLRRDGAW